MDLGWDSSQRGSGAGSNDTEQYQDDWCPYDVNTDAWNNSENSEVFWGDQGQDYQM